MNTEPFNKNTISQSGINLLDQSALKLNNNNSINGADDGYTVLQTNKLINNLYNDNSTTKTGSCNDTISYYSLDYTKGNNTMNSFYNLDKPSPSKMVPLHSLGDGNLINNFSDLQDNVNNCDFNASNEFLDKLNNGYNNQQLGQFRTSLFDSMDNAFEKKNFERQFNTVQNHPNPTNEDKARKWIYATPTTCKETSAQCLEYEDLSRKRSPII